MSLPSTLSGALLRDLDWKILLFLNRPEDAADKIMIFTNNPHLWNTSINPIICTDQSLPPIPSYYSHRDYDILEEIGAHLVHMIGTEYRTAFSACLVAFGEKDSPRIHLALSADPNCNLGQVCLKNWHFWPRKEEPERAIAEGIVRAVLRQYAVPPQRWTSGGDIGIEWNARLSPADSGPWTENDLDSVEGVVRRARYPSETPEYKPVLQSIDEEMPSTSGSGKT